MIALATFKAKLIAGAIGLAILTAACFAIYTSIYNRGWHAAIEAVAARDKEAVDAADKARARVRACYDAGGVWAEGACKR
jgi:hypothetical protein